MLCSHRVHLQHPVQRHAIEAGSLENHGTYLDVWPLLWNITFGPSDVQNFYFSFKHFFYMAALCYDDTRRYTADTLQWWVVALLLPTLAASWLMARRMQDSAVFSTEAWSLDQLNSANWSVESMIVNAVKMVSTKQSSGYRSQAYWCLALANHLRIPAFLATGEVGELIAFRLSTSKGG